MCCFGATFVVAVVVAAGFTVLDDFALFIEFLDSSGRVVALMLGADALPPTIPFVAGDFFLVPETEDAASDNLTAVGDGGC